MWTCVLVLHEEYFEFFGRVHTKCDIDFSLSLQQQLYDEAEKTLPPAEEVENDRQQRVNRGQPSTVGQVQRDRDGLRHTNAISVRTMIPNCYVTKSCFNFS